MQKIAFIAFFLFTFSATIAQVDSVSQINYIEIDSLSVEKHNVSDSAHSPKLATIFSAILPGTGQIYNDIYKPKNRKSRLWWKLPLIYGGMGTGIYFIVSNQNQYSYYRKERKTLFDQNLYYSADGYNDSQLKSITDQYARWRDLSAVGTLAIYLLNIVDANVEGTLLHFDSSDDLSIQIDPSMINVAQNSFPGATLRIKF